MSQYTTVQDQLLYLILIPHVILFLFILAFSKGIVSRVLGEARGSFIYLLSLVVYIFIVISGWYGSFLIPLFNAWLIVLLIVGLFLFGLSAVIGPGRLSEAKKFAGAAAETVAAKTTGPAEKRKSLESEIELVTEQIRGIDTQLRRGGNTVDTITFLNNQKSALTAQKTKLEHELNKL